MSNLNVSGAVLSLIASQESDDAELGISQAVAERAFELLSNNPDAVAGLIKAALSENGLTNNAEVEKLQEFVAENEGKKNYLLCGALAGEQSDTTHVVIAKSAEEAKEKFFFRLWTDAGFPEIDEDPLLDNFYVVRCDLLSEAMEESVDDEPTAEFKGLFESHS